MVFESDIPNLSEGASFAILALSHRSAFDHDGGIETCIRREIEITCSVGLQYLHVFPASQAEEPLQSKPYDLIAATYTDAGEPPTINSITIFSLTRLAQKSNVKAFVIHSLIGHSLPWVSSIARLADKRGIKVLMFIHDFSIACSSYHLVRGDLNQGEYCQVLEQGERVCAGCSHQPTRYMYMRYVKSVLMSSSIILTPSDYVKINILDLYEGSVEKLSTKTYILPHYSAEEISECLLESRREMPATKLVYTLAYYGACVKHKGWFKFLELAKQMSSPEHLKYAYISSENRYIDGFEWIGHSSRRGDNFSSLRNKVSKHNISCFFFWSTVPETYAISFHEAWATGRPILCSSFVYSKITKDIIDRRNIVELSSLDEAEKILSDERRIEGLLLNCTTNPKSLALSMMSMHILANTVH